MKKMTTGLDIDKMRYLQSIAQSLQTIARELHQNNEILKEIKDELLDGIKTYEQNT